jgi:hypothetical protein
MPLTPSQCCTRKVIWKPRNIVQKWTFPSQSFIIRPVALGNQKYTPAKAANTTVPKTV